MGGNHWHRNVKKGYQNIYTSFIRAVTHHIWLLDWTLPRYSCYCLFNKKLYPIFKIKIDRTFGNFCEPDGFSYQIYETYKSKREPEMIVLARVLKKVEKNSCRSTGVNCAVWRVCKTACWRSLGLRKWLPISRGAAQICPCYWLQETWILM